MILLALFLLVRFVLYNQLVQLNHVGLYFQWVQCGHNFLSFQWVQIDRFDP